MTPGLLLILALLTQPVDEAVSTAPPQPTAEQEANASAGEPLPPGAPTEPYELTAWCYGALGEYLTVYDRVIPDLRDIDSTFGASVHNEAQPYAEDVAAARLALTRFAAALRSAERASPQPISQRGAAAIQQGRGIWSVAERGSRRALARAWLYWGIPDQCDITARALRQRSVSALAALSPAEAAAARSRPGAVALAPLTAPLPEGRTAVAAVMPPTVAPPPVAVATAPPPPRPPSRIIEDPPIAAAPPALAAPPAPPRPASGPPPVPAIVASVQAPPAPPMAPLPPAAAPSPPSPTLAPAPAPPPVLVTATAGPDEPMEPRL